ncbi:hypothetical protein Tco_0495956 [Tanacetum coccineum]
MLNQLIATRVAEALAAAAVTHAASTQEKTNLGSNSSQNKACNYKEFRAVMHENFCGTEGAVGLTRWFEKLESQFGISNVAEGDRVKFASSTLLDSALTWWNVYVRSVTLDTAHATPRSDFRAMFIRKPYLTSRFEIFTMYIEVNHSDFNNGYLFGDKRVSDTFGLRSDTWCDVDKNGCGHVTLLVYEIAVL